MTVAEYLEATGLTIYALSRKTGISYTTLHPHVRGKHDLSVETARRLEEFDPKMSAADILGLKKAAAGKQAKKIGRCAAGAR